MIKELIIEGQRLLSEMQDDKEEIEQSLIELKKNNAPCRQIIETEATLRLYLGLIETQKAIIDLLMEKENENH